MAEEDEEDGLWAGEGDFVAPGSSIAGSGEGGDFSRHLVACFGYLGRGLILVRDCLRDRVYFLGRLGTRCWSTANWGWRLKTAALEGR